jgi:hypothetical protein
VSPKPISLGFTSNPGRAPTAGSALLANCYAEIAGDEQKAKVQVWASDGLEVLSESSSTDGTRAMIDVDGVVYKVRGRRIYRCEPAAIGATEIEIGGIASDAPVTMARNRRPVPQIGVCSQDGQYVVIEAGVTTDYSSAIRSGANSVAFLDGFFIFTHDDGSVSHTNEDDATTADPLAFASAESSPDPAIRGMVKQREFVAFGTRSVEFFANAGTDPFAFARNQAIDLGCGASAACAQVDQTIVFVASDLTVRILNGYQAVRISTHAVERAIAAEPDISTAIAVTWTRDGHTFYCLSGATFSYVYDLTTQFWHNRESYNDTRWLASCIVESGKELVVGAYNGGTLYRMKRDVFTEGDNPLICKIVPPPVHAWPERVKINALYLDIIPGVGRNVYELPAFDLYWGSEILAWGSETLTWGQTIYDGLGDYSAYEPEVILRTSLDGGESWSAERRAKLGQMGDKLRRVVFRRIGATRQHGITFEISCSAAVMRGFLGAAVDADKLAA